MDIVKAFKEKIESLTDKEFNNMISKIRKDVDSTPSVQDYLYATERTTIAENMKVGAKLLDGVLYDKAILKEIGDKPFYELKVVNMQINNSMPVELVWSNIPGFELYGVPYTEEIGVMLKVLQYDLCEVLEYETPEKNTLYRAFIARYRYTKP